MDEELSLSEMVQNAMGQSVTPSRLKDDVSPGFIKSLLGGAEISGPFYSDLRPGECPHYLFRGIGLSLPEEDDPHSDEHFVLGSESGTIAVALITDQRTIVYYGGDGERNQISIEHVDIVDIEFGDGMVLNKLSLTSTQYSIKLSQDFGYPYSSELADASAYISDQAGVEQEKTGFDFESGDVDAAKSALADQLSNIDGLKDEIDIGKVTHQAFQGASIGIKRGQITGLLGLVVFGGIEIYNQLNESEAADINTEDIDPEETAEDIVKYQKVGESSKYSGMELATGAIGAALSVDKQTSGREVTRVLSEMDLEWINRQLEAGEDSDSAIQVASEAVDAYATEISWLADQEPADRS